MRIFMQIRAQEIIVIRDFLVSGKLFVHETLNKTQESKITSR